jgi:DNA-binding winged helix-turn-helix (wHTH) protein
MERVSPRIRYRFADFTLSRTRRVLLREGREVPLIPRYLDLLLLLVERREEALHKREILDRVWSEVIVSDGALSQAVRTLRRTLHEEGSGRDFIRTVSRHGYQFVCPVVEEPESEEGQGSTSGEGSQGLPGRAEPDAGSGAPDSRAGPLERLLAPASTDEERREAAETLHDLGTEEALRRVAGRPGSAQAWAYLRDTRWDVPGAGRVPLSAAPLRWAAWSGLAALRLRRAKRLAGERWAAASFGGAAAGLLAGTTGGFALAGLRGQPVEPGLVASLALVGATVGALGAAGVGSGLAAAEALIRSRRTLALMVLAALSGGLTGALAHALVRGLLGAVLGQDFPALGGGPEGLAIGAAAGLGYGLATPRPSGGMATPHGSQRLIAAASTAVACALVAAGVSALGGQLGGASLDTIARSFPTSRVRLDALGTLLGEPGFGPRTRGALSAFEGLLFGAGLALGLTRRPVPRDLNHS